ncbi:unnamed protein product [Amoebophrya sp. A120]|nr:unnamed protein product [Amoebophrya sp. A120]|eukprot:GSA120T00008704001.1
MFENMRIPPEDEHVQYCTTDPEVVQEVFNLGNSDIVRKNLPCPYRKGNLGC